MLHRLASRARRHGVHALLGLWLVMGAVLGADLLASHLVTLPTPAADDPALRQAMIAARPAATRGRWLMVHVLLQSCGCSRRILQHLETDARPADVGELVVLVAPPGAADPRAIAALTTRGFAVRVVAPEALRPDLHVDAAPLLVILDPADAVRYVGGYTRRKQSPDVHDVAILADLRAGTQPEALPSFGCAVSQGLARKLDPLGIKRLN
jgi:hypothetical protein